MNDQPQVYLASGYCLIDKSHIYTGANQSKPSVLHGRKINLHTLQYNLFGDDFITKKYCKYL